MCGICGIAVHAGEPPRVDVLDEMCRTMTHRGPDDQGAVVAGAVGLGMRRLAIIDLAGGRQPIANEDETCWIVCNGELYNYRELRESLRRAGHRFVTRSDTEVALHAYEEWGDDFPRRLDGMFALAIWDRRSRRLTLVRDRAGIKPLHYVHSGGRLLFGSEIKALLAAPGVPRRVDPAALADYLALEYVPTPRCMLADVRKLPPGHALTWRQSDGGVSIRRWWDVDLAAAERPDLGPAALDARAALLRDALREAVRRELVADVPVGVFLSGGIDSSAVAAMMAELTPGNVRSFSIGFADRSFDESGHARRVARHLGTEHRELVLEPRMLEELVPRVGELLDEPMADASIIPTYLLSRFTREHVKVALGGDGGDELLAGYPTLIAHRLSRPYRALPGFVRAGLVPAAVARLPVSTGNLSFDFRARRFVAGAGLPVGERHVRWMGAFAPEAVTDLLAPDVAAGLAEPAAARAVRDLLGGQPLRDELNQVLYLDMKLYLENDILVKLDRASMMASLEARVPLLDAAFMEHVIRLPLHCKLRGLRSKYLLRRALRGILPDEILSRPKKGFGIPVARWFRGPLRELLLDTLHRDRIERDGLLSWPAVERLLREHLAGRADHRKGLWTLFIFQRWHDAWVTGATTLRRSA